MLLIAVEYLVANEGRAGQILVLSTSVAVCAMFGHRYLRRIRAERASIAANSHRIPVIVFGAAAVLLAMPSATGEELRRLHAVVRAAGLDTLVMPPVQQLVDEGSPREITRYRDEDVLNRRIVDIDNAAVSRLVADSRVLVTGAGGSIGSEPIRQLAMLNPASLIALDRDDSLLHHVIASLPEPQRQLCIPVIADIRDADRLDEIFAHHRPQFVFHAAALKHVPALEGAPSEGWKTNVLGTGNVLEACERHGVGRVVNISTDKAANPSNVLGYTKRIAERLTAASAARTNHPYVSVRFGNVIGSRGSAIETFERQIASGGPVTVTHPEMTRYFMAVREAVRLTMQASAIGRPGEVLVLDMGTPVKVLDVARQLIERSGNDVTITFTGLRPGEKMHEQLLGAGERAARPLHPMIDHVSVPALDLVRGLDACAAVGVSPITLDGLMTVASSAPNNHTVNLVHTLQADHNGPATRPKTSTVRRYCDSFANGVYAVEAQVAPPAAPVTTTTIVLPQPPGALPATGSSGVSSILGLGVLLMVGGGIVVVATRRRSSASSPVT